MISDLLSFKIQYIWPSIDLGWGVRFLSLLILVWLVYFLVRTGKRALLVPVIANLVFAAAFAASGTIDENEIGFRIGIPGIVICLAILIVPSIYNRISPQLFLLMLCAFGITAAANILWVYFFWLCSCLIVYMAAMPDNNTFYRFASIDALLGLAVLTTAMVYEIISGAVPDSPLISAPAVVFCARAAALLLVVWRIVCLCLLLLVKSRKQAIKALEAPDALETPEATEADDRG